MTKTEMEAKMKEACHRGVALFEDAPCYPVEPLVRLFHLGRDFGKQTDEAVMEGMLEEYRSILQTIRPIEKAPERIYLWPEGKMPKNTDYTDNSDYKYNHDPDFKPYLYEMLVPEEVEPKGAVVLCAGGDHGDASFHEAFQSCRDLNDLGYQCFLLLNRTHRCPWSKQECGADAARAIRMIRANAAKYRISSGRVSFAGFSNGGVTGEACIRYYSGKQTVKDHFPEYEPDWLDEYKGAPDSFLCIYGPRWATEEFDYTGVVYPPTFFAVGRDDTAMDNLNHTYPDLAAHGVELEVHTFAGVPHGKAGVKLVGEEGYDNFHLWLPLGDAFMQDVYRKAEAKKRDEMQGKTE